MAISKKATLKAPVKASSAAHKSHAASHPTWVEMIKECIIAHPDDARTGVSRPTIKKFVESKYHIDLNASTASQLNRAITSGSEKGTFVLPKGTSGKVKLALKARNDATKENTTPVAKKPVYAKTSVTKSKTTTVKPIPAKKAVSKPKVATATPLKANRVKPVALTTKTAVKKKPSVSAKRTAAKKLPTRKKTTTKKGATKKVVTGSAKKPVPKSTTAVKAKSPSKAKPVSKTKPTSKAKPASKSTPKKSASQKV